MDLKRIPSAGRPLTRRALLTAGAAAASAWGSTARLRPNVAAEIPDRMVRTVREHALPISAGPSAFEPILDMAANASFVLLGEASHGTHEFYATRALLTRRLIQEHGFNAVVIEANWSHAARVNSYVRGLGPDATAEQALSGFTGFPEWMWRNTDVRDFVAWLREWNTGVPAGAAPTGFYGMDLYSLFESRDAVMEYLRGADPAEAESAAERYRRFEPFSDPQKYGAAAVNGWRKSGAKGAREQFERMVRLTAPRIDSADSDTATKAFHAQQNARVVRNAEEYYREMYSGAVNTWNLRDRHMADTLDAIASHLRKRDGHARIVVWAHNSHLGDAAQRKPAGAANGTLANSCASATQARPCWSDSVRTPER